MTVPVKLAAKVATTPLTVVTKKKEQTFLFDVVIFLILLSLGLLFFAVILAVSKAYMVSNMPVSMSPPPPSLPQTPDAIITFKDSVGNFWETTIRKVSHDGSPLNDGNPEFENKVTRVWRFFNDKAKSSVSESDKLLIVTPPESDKPAEDILRFQQQESSEKPGLIVYEPDSSFIKAPAVSKNIQSVEDSELEYYF